MSFQEPPWQTGMPEDSPPVSWSTPTAQQFVDKSSPEVASVGRRVAARLLDAIVWSVCFFVAVVFTMLLELGEGVEDFVIWTITYALIILTEWFGRSRTLGKMVFKLQIVQDDGEPIGWTRSTARVLLLTLSVAFLPLIGLDIYRDVESSTPQGLSVADGFGVASMLLAVVVTLASVVTVLVRADKKALWDMVAQTQVRSNQM